MNKIGPLIEDKMKKMEAESVAKPEKAAKN